LDRNSSGTPMAPPITAAPTALTPQIIMVNPVDSFTTFLAPLSRMKDRLGLREGGGASGGELPRKGKGHAALCRAQGL
jgi:hypothetical protein